MKRPPPLFRPQRAVFLAISPFVILAPVILAMSTMSAPARAAGPALPAPLEAGETRRVAEVIDADTVRLEGEKGQPGRQVRLVGLQGPKLPLGRPNYPTWPLAPEARGHLASLIGDAPVTLHYGGAREDRHGRILAHLVTPDGTWIQGAMLQAGFARVYTFDDNRSLIAEMLALEAEARRRRRGIWAEPYYRVRTP
jgi:endonuclease YncB( thermonuclease family)